MNNNISVGIQLKADGSGLVGEVRRSDRQVAKLGKTAMMAGKDARQGAKGIDRFGDESKKTTREARRLNKQTRNLGRSFGALRTAAAALGLGLLTRDIISTASAYQQLDTRLKGLVGSGDSFAETKAYLTETADLLGQRVNVLSDSYARLLPLINSGLLSVSDGRSVLEGFANVTAKTGASSAQLGQAMFGLAQGLSSGVLRAEELNQVTEPLPGLLQELDKAAGLSAGGFRKMVNAGRVTSDMFRDTLIGALLAYEGAAEAASGNVAQSYNRMLNSWDRVKIEFSNTGFLDGIVDGLKELNETISDPSFRQSMSEFGSLTGKMINMLVQHGDKAASIAAALYGARLGGTVGGPWGAAGGAALFGGGTYMALNNPWGDDTPVKPKTPPPMPSPVNLPLPPGMGSFQPHNDTPEYARRSSVLGDELKNLQALYSARLQDQRLYDMTKDSITAETEVRRIAQDAIKDGHPLLLSEQEALKKLILDISGYTQKLSEAEAAERRHTATVAEIQSAYESLPKSYEQTTAAAGRWRTETLAGLDETRTGYNDFASQVEEIYRGMMIDAYEENLSASREWEAGVIRGFQSVADEANDMASQMESAITNAASSMEDAFVDLYQTGSFNFKKLADSIIQDMIRMQVRSQITGPLSEGLGSLFKGMFSFGGGGPDDEGSSYGVGHTGGIVGDLTASRRVDPRLFDGAPRFHGGGLVAGERAIVAKEGEGVFTPQQMNNADRLFAAAMSRPAPSPPKIIINDHRSGDSPDIQFDQSIGPEGDYVTKLIIPAVEDALDGGHLDGSLGRNFNLNRRPESGS